MKCSGCHRRPSEIDEYREASRAMDMSPNDYVRSEEGTFNRQNDHFLCTECYIKAGMPSAPGGWIAP